VKQFIGTCVENPFRSVSKLNFIIEHGKGISQKEFLASCEIEPETELEMSRFPNDYEFYQSCDGIMFYTWSAIEHFYK
jgi:hypothetical protein